MISPELRARALRSLSLSDDALLAECRIDVFVGGGPGGQHRNKTESAVRLSHGPTGLSVTATERRSQLQNRAAALERLRRALISMTHVPKSRRPTRPTRGSQERRIESKKLTARKKAARRGDW